MDYNRPVYEDKLLPLGRLRESKIQVNRADMVIESAHLSETIFLAV